MQRLQQLLFSKLAKASGWLFAGGVAGGMLAYVFQVVMGRMLSVEEYGLFTALMALMAVTGAPLGTLTMVVSRKVSAYRVNQEIGNLTNLFYIINLKALVFIFILLLSSMFFMEAVKSFLKVEDTNHIYLLVMLVIISFPHAINNAYLQGLQYFKWLSFSVLLTFLFRIIFAVLLVWLGFGVTGALGGVALSAIIILVLIYIVLYTQLKKGRECDYNVGHLSFRSSIPVLLANIAFVIMSQFDMILVKYYFTEQEAGLYAAASVLGKAVMHLPGGIAMALFPLVAENHVGGKSSINLLIQSVGVTSLLCGAGAIIYYFFADYIIVLLYGADYQEASDILKYYGFAILPMALVMIAEYYLIAMGKVIFAYLFMIIAPLQLIAIYYYHESFLQIILILGISGFLLTVIGYGLLWRAYKIEK